MDDKNGNVRVVDAKKCIGCDECIEACPYTPSSVSRNFENSRAIKCDLCADTPFWKEKGGVDGKRACEEICPMRAIKFTKEVPAQTGDKAYETNLRGTNWAMLGYQEPYKEQK